MNSDSTKSIAIRTSLLITFGLTLLFLLIDYSNQTLQNPLYYLAFITLSLLIVYLTLRSVFEKQINQKIQKVYDTINSLGSKEKSVKEDFDSDTDVFQQVNEVVLNWAQSKKQEIEELKKQENYRREFLGNVSHELKTPIFNIQGYIHTLLDGAINDPEVNSRYLGKAASNVERISAIVEDLEAISMLETGELELELETFNIQELIQDIMDQNELKAKERNISIGFKDGSSKPYHVEADSDRIKQVITNLIINSIKYGKDNGRTLVGLYDMGDHILVEVSDNGIGINEKDLPRLFERFFRVDKSRSREQGGTGLGLSIVKHLIEAHNQSLQVRSKLGVGSTFSFTLKKA